MTIIKYIIPLVFVVAIFLFVTTGKEEISEKDKSRIEYKRVTYDFGSIMYEPVAYKVFEAGFLIKYPREATIYKYSKDEAQQRTNRRVENGIDAINISLASQTAEGTELFDGLSIDLMYYKNTNRLLLENIVPPISNNSHPTEGDITLRKATNVGGITGIKTLVCCWGGGTTYYYFLSRNEEYVIEFQVFSAGPEKEKFNEVADKIVDSLEAIN